MISIQSQLFTPQPEKALGDFRFHPWLPARRAGSRSGFKNILSGLDLRNYKG